MTKTTSRPRYKILWWENESPVRRVKGFFGAKGISALCREVLKENLAGGRVAITVHWRSKTTFTHKIVFIFGIADHMRRYREQAGLNVTLDKELEKEVLARL
jgi:hypothetical protein